MKLEHEFTVPTSVDEAWRVLLDVERVAPCMPGATLLTVDRDEFTGTVKVKVGPIQVVYKGRARFVDLDESAHRVVIEASGKEARGSGTAAATVVAQMRPSGDATTVSVETDLNVTGRPAQFGRGAMEEVAAKLIDQFAKRLAEELASPAAAAKSAEPIAPPLATEASKSAPARAATKLAPTAAVPATKASIGETSAPIESSGPRVVPPPLREAEPINLLDVAGGSVAKRLVPVASVLAVLLILRGRRSRLRRRRPMA